MEDRFKTYDRVTHVLSPFSGYSKIDPIILERAANRGTVVHQAIKEYIMGVSMWTDVPESYEGYLDSFHGFWNTNQHLVPFSCETRYGHATLEYTGQVDFIAIDDKGLHLFDWKTSSKPNITWEYQASAYAEMLRSEGNKVASCTFVHLRKDGKEAKQIKFCPDDTEKLSIFKSMLNIYRMFFKNQNQIETEGL